MGIHFCFANLEACESIMEEAIPAAFEENDEGISQGSLRFDLAVNQVEPLDPDNYGKRRGVQTRRSSNLSPPR